MCIGWSVGRLGRWWRAQAPRTAACPWDPNATIVPVAATPIARELIAAIDSGDIHAAFQPIVSLAGEKTVGYEALARGPEGTKFHSPVALFGMADRLDADIGAETVVVGGQPMFWASAEIDNRGPKLVPGTSGVGKMSSNLREF